MKITTDAEVRGEQVRLELSEKDFCPECCGTLQEAAGSRPGLRCTSCWAVYTPIKEQKDAETEKR